MGILKNAIRKTLASFGYELRRSTDKNVRFENFVNLATAYEQYLNNEDDLILPNEIRPVLLGRLLGTPPSEAYFIVQALSKCKDVAGDVCEFGVAQGETSALIANEIALTGNKCLHLFDSFKDSQRLLTRTNLMTILLRWGVSKPMLEKCHSRKIWSVVVWMRYLFPRIGMSFIKDSSNN